MNSAEKYRDHAERWTEEAYADPAGYLRRRAAVVVSLGPPLGPGDTVLDLACGDGGLAEPLLARGLRYVGVDLSDEMVAAASRRLAGRADAGARIGDLNDFEPDEPVAATTCFRAVYYARDRAAFFRQVASYTEKKLVFDLNPRRYDVEAVGADLRAAGFGRLELRPFFFPQTRDLPTAAARVLEAVERIGPLARAALRFRFTYVCAASR
jgi:SAM-dependent methyltransferase